MSRKKVYGTNKERVAYYEVQNKGPNNGGYLLVAYDGPSSDKPIGCFKSEDKIREELDDMEESSIFEMFSVDDWALDYVPESALDEILKEDAAGMTKDNIITKILNGIMHIIDWIKRRLRILVRNIKYRVKNRQVLDGADGLAIEVKEGDSPSQTELVIDFAHSFVHDENSIRTIKIFRVKRLLKILDKDGMFWQLSDSFRKWSDAGFHNVSMTFNKNMKEYKHMFEHEDVTGIPDLYTINDQNFSKALEIFDQYSKTFRDFYAGLKINDFKNERDFIYVVEGFNILMEIIRSIASDINLFNI